MEFGTFVYDILGALVIAAGLAAGGAFVKIARLGDHVERLAADAIKNMNLIKEDVDELKANMKGDKNRCAVQSDEVKRQLLAEVATLRRSINEELSNVRETNREVKQQIMSEVATLRARVESLLTSAVTREELHRHADSSLAVLNRIEQRLNQVR